MLKDLLSKISNIYYSFFKDISPIEIKKLNIGSIKIIKKGGLISNSKNLSNSSLLYGNSDSIKFNMILKSLSVHKLSILYHLHYNVKREDIKF
jgi:hypothetical protein